MSLDGARISAAALGHRRVLADPVGQLSLVLALLVAIVAMLALPLSAQSTQDDAIRQLARAAGPLDVLVSRRSDPSAPDTVRFQDDAVTSALTQALAGLAPEVIVVRRAPVLEVRAGTGPAAQVPASSATALVVPSTVPVLSGAWPSAPGEAALIDNQAARLHVGLGDRVVVSPRSVPGAGPRAGPSSELLITALVAPDPTWRGDGVSLLLSTPESLQSLGTAIGDSSWTSTIRARARGERLGTDTAQSARNRLAGLPTELKRLLPEANTTVDDRLTPVLNDALARSADVAVGRDRIWLQVILLVLGALIAVGAVIAASLRPLVRTLSARGLGSGFLLATVVSQVGLLCLAAAAVCGVILVALRLSGAAASWLPAAAGAATPMNADGGTLTGVLLAVLVAGVAAWAVVSLTAVALSGLTRPATRLATLTQPFGSGVRWRFDPLTLAGLGAICFILWQLEQARRAERLGERDPLLLIAVGSLVVIGVLVVSAALATAGRLVARSARRTRSVTPLGVVVALRAERAQRLPWVAYGAGLATLLGLISATTTLHQVVLNTIARNAGAPLLVLAPRSADSIGALREADPVPRIQLTQALSEASPGAAICAVATSTARVGGAEVPLIAVDSRQVAAVTSEAGSGAISATSAGLLQAPKFLKGTTAERVTISVTVRRQSFPEAAGFRLVDGDIPLEANLIVAGADDVPALVPAGEIALRSLGYAGDGVVTAASSSEPYLAGEGSLEIDLTAIGVASLRVMGLQLRVPLTPLERTLVSGSLRLDADTGAAGQLRALEEGLAGVRRSTTLVDGKFSVDASQTQQRSDAVSVTWAGVDEQEQARITQRLPVIARAGSISAAGGVGSDIELIVAEQRIPARVVEIKSTLPGSLASDPLAIPDLTHGTSQMPEVMLDQVALAWAQLAAGRRPTPATQWWVAPTSGAQSSSSVASREHVQALGATALAAGLATEAIEVREVSATAIGLENGPLLGGARRTLRIAGVLTVLLTLLSALAAHSASRTRRRADSRVLQALGLSARARHALGLARLGTAVALASAAGLIVSTAAQPVLAPAITRGWLVPVLGGDGVVASTRPWMLWAAACLAFAGLLVCVQVLDVLTRRLGRIVRRAGMRRG